MTVLVIGGTGKTGRLVIQELLNHNYRVKIVIREQSKLPLNFTSNSKVNIINETILDMSNNRLVDIICDCDAVISCLGHNVSCQGMFGQPRNLVTESLQKICLGIQNVISQKTIKLVLMNSVAVRNLNLNEMVYPSQKYVTFLLRKLLPPHLDNEKASDFLRTTLGQNSTSIQWVSVRPTSLINSDEEVPYSIYISPIENPIFGSKKVSRRNVAKFMVELILNETLWNEWKGQMPVIYNQ